MGRLPQRRRPGYKTVAAASVGRRVGAEAVERRGYGRDAAPLIPGSSTDHRPCDESRWVSRVSCVWDHLVDMSVYTGCVV